MRSKRRNKSVKLTSKRKGQRRKQKRYFQMDLTDGNGPSKQNERMKAMQLNATTPGAKKSRIMASQNQNVSRTSFIESMDEVPTTSANAKMNGSKFKKFRDDLRPNKRKRKRQLTSQNKRAKYSIGQTVTKKILHSIKRRQLKTVSPKRPLRSVSRRKLNLEQTEMQLLKSSTPREPSKRKTLSPISHSKEEGEIQSDSDDDCIYIEPKIEQILIDDETAPTEQVSRIVNLKEKNMGVIVTSTPFDKTKMPTKCSIDNSSALKTTPPTTAQALFFEDVRPTAWFDNTASADTAADYTKLSTLHERSTSKRRSVRLKPKDTQEVIEIDDTLCEIEERKSDTVDDSVVFVGETFSNDFISLLTSRTAKTPIKQVTPQRKKTVAVNTLFTSSEQKQLKQYNTNAYNPNTGSELQTTKRLVIIDASNVAFNHSINKGFSVKGLKICIDYFEKMDHEVKAIVPRFRLNKNKSTDYEMMNELFNSGKVVITPCKNLPDKMTTSYDDRFILQLACELDAAIVSNDNYRDLIHENSAFKKIIENRVIGYTWCNDIFILPKDPYGKWGPSLHTILNRSFK